MGLASALKGLCKSTAALLILTTALNFALIGCIVIAGCVAVKLLPYSVLVPDALLFGGMGLGAAMLLFSMFGCCGVIGKARKCWLRMFMLCDLLIFCAAAGICVFLFIGDSALSVMEKQHFMNLTGLDAAAAQTLRAQVQTAWTGCGASVMPWPGKVGTAGDTGLTMMLNCSNPKVAAFAQYVNFGIGGSGGCLGERNPVPTSRASTYWNCFTSEVFDVAGAASMTTAASIDTDTGLFCQCYSAFADVASKYTVPGKWVGVGLASFFLLVFFACGFLFCCASDFFADHDV